ncbi:DNA polymerase III subunit beta [Aureimonas sp. SK2]|uniref:DNA polymerase III subunit beta n=1 Tax=Aureimonas sp. SK2 TaxID=3015992 RepID=UPI002444EABD|nr:DNA polymerase III subunit beta [Aureimonas sp. SK2]
MTDTALAFSIDRGCLAAAVERVSRVVQKRNTMEILGHILIKAEAGSVTLRGTDLELDALVRVEGAAIGTPGGLAVPSAEFAAALARWPDGVLTVESDGRRLTAKVGRSRASLPVLPEVDFPDIRRGDTDTTFQIPGSDLTAMAEKCGFAVGTDEVRAYLMGIYLHATDRNLVAVATDGHRLSRFDMPMPDGAESMEGVIIPNRTVRIWPHLLGKDESDPVQVETGEGFIRFSSDLMVLHSKLVGGTYPDYLRVIPRGNNQVALASVSDLTTAVDRLMVFSKDKGHGLKVAFGTGEIRLSIRSEAGEAEEFVPAECDFDMEIGFNGKYLREMLTTMKGPQVRLAMADPGSPPLVTDEADPRREIVVMPMRV